jgi:hemerythrin
MELTETNLLNWNDKMCVGVEVMDSEHRELSQAINDLHAAALQDRQQSLTGPLLRKVAEVARAHFSSEEGLMVSSNYPGMALHLFKHQYLMQQVDALQGRVNRGGFKLTEHSLSFLNHWFTAHIQEEDTQFALWLNDPGKR